MNPDALIPTSLIHSVECLKVLSDRKKIVPNIVTDISLLTECEGCMVEYWPWVNGE